MPDFLNDKSEKKVEYIELIYDLIFVYVIGRNNSLLHALQGGFIRPEAYLTYIITTLIVLQIWYSTTLFINRYGSNGALEYIGMFVNMYFLYYMADATRVQWQELYVRYNVAWGLILVNLGVQYFVKLRKGAGLMPLEALNQKHYMRTLFIQAGIVFVSIPVYLLTGLPLSPLAMVFGLGAALVTNRKNRLVMVDFPHLTERVMLYVVFTFGEMIIGIAGYFDDGMSWKSLYYSLMGFLIIAGLFMSYGFVYEHIIDRNKETTGTGYMLLHVFLITALNNITTALEFMQRSAVSTVPKNVFLVGSFLLYFIFLFLLEKFALVRLRKNRLYFRILLILSAVFVVLMAVLYPYPVASIAVSVLFIYGVYGIIRMYARRSRTQSEES